MNTSDSSNDPSLVDPETNPYGLLICDELTVSAWYPNVPALIRDLKSGTLEDAFVQGERSLPAVLARATTWEEVLSAKKELETYLFDDEVSDDNWVEPVMWPEPLKSTAPLWVRFREMFLESREIESEDSSIPEDLLEDFMEYLKSAE